MNLCIVRKIIIVISDKIIVVLNLQKSNFDNSYYY